MFNTQGQIILYQKTFVINHFNLCIIIPFFFKWLILWWSSSLTHMHQRASMDFVIIIQWSCWGVYWFHSIRLSVRPSVPRPSRVCPASCVRSVAPTVLVGSISYLYILSWNFRTCVVCKVSCKIAKFQVLAIFLICNFDFVLFWLGIWCESLVWLIMGRRRVSHNAGVLVALVVPTFGLAPSGTRSSASTVLIEKDMLLSKIF